jgi:hypothetical protein
MKANKYPITIKKLPKGVKEAWYYGGREKSIHLITQPKEITFGEEIKITITIPSEQIDINITEKKKYKSADCVL